MTADAPHVRCPRPARRAAPVLALLLALPLLLSSCGGGGAPTPEALVFEDVTLTLFRPFAAGTYAWRSQAELDAALAAAPFRVFPIGLVTSEPAVPRYDYARQALVGVSLGEGSWCTAPRIDAVLRTGDDLLVRYRAATSGTLACSRLAPLIGFALVPTFSGSLRFERIAE